MTGGWEGSGYPSQVRIGHHGGAMIQGLLALLAAVGGMLLTGSLVKRAARDRLLYLVALSVTQAGLALALLAMAGGFLFGFGPLLFRVLSVGAALLGPLWLALGMIELIARPVQVRFGARLVVISYSVVAGVILLADPTRGKFTTNLPKPRETYDVLPPLLIDGAHVIAVIALVGCLVVTAMQAGRQDRQAAGLLIPIALVALAGVLVVSGSRGFLPGLLAVLALTAASGMVWHGAMRTIPKDAADGAYGDGYGDQYGDGYGGGYDEPATGYEEERYMEQGYGDRGPGYGPVPPPGPGAGPRRGRRAAGRGEPRFPDQPLREEPAVPPPGRYPDSPAATANDDLRSMISDAPLPGAMPAPGGFDLPGGVGQITVYTLLDGREEAFDRQAEDLVRAARANEPDTLVFTCHEVVNAPTQRIFYQLFRDQAAFAAHQRQPYLRRFLAESRTHVLTTNVIELKLGSAKLPPPAPDPMSRSR
jgi:quinol monooxygenase YgiN